MNLSNAVCSTRGDGYWSNCARKVSLTKARLAYLDDDNDFGELRVYFDTKSWDVEEHGLIYTDSMFLKELRALLETLGFAKQEAKDVDYSEQGMQGDNYVSLDVGGVFIAGWNRLNP